MRTARWLSGSRGRVLYGKVDLKGGLVPRSCFMAKKRRTPKEDQLPAPPSARSRTLPEGYDAFLKDLKERIRATQIKAALAVNRELVLHYWQIGRDILAQQQQHGWGAKIIDLLARDLHLAFPDVQGFSPRNLKYMRAFAQAWPDEAIVQQLAAQIPWFHNCLLLDKVKDPAEREWYIRKTREHGWSRAILDHQIDSGLYRRQGKAVTNFTRTLPPPQSDLADEVLKNPYAFDFLTLADDARSTFITRLVESLPAHLQSSLPTVAQLEAELQAAQAPRPRRGAEGETLTLSYLCTRLQEKSSAG